MAVRKRGNRWAVEVYDRDRPSGKFHVGTFDTQREARGAEREHLAKRGRQKPRGSPETVASFANRWLDLRPRTKDSTNQAYREQVRPFAEKHGDLLLDEVGVELALEWLSEKRWTHGGIRAMFSDARRMGLVEANPFTGLRLRGARGRKDLDVLSVTEVEALVACVEEVWSGEVGLSVQALILMAAFTGMRPAEMYGLRWSDFDIRDGEIRVARQYAPKSRSFELPKNGLTRRIVLTPRARDGLLALPRPMDAEALLFRTARGRPMTGRVQHYYWHPVRCRFGKPSMDLYELRHFCASWLLNDLGLPPQDVAHQLGHTDGGALVQKLYGHPSESLARERIKRAVGGSGPRVAEISEAQRRQGES